MCARRDSAHEIPWEAQGAQMQINVFAIRYSGGSWQEYQHVCSPEEANAIIESGAVKAEDRFRYRIAQDSDVLTRASNVFNVARGQDDNPAEGDTVVFGVQVDD